MFDAKAFVKEFWDMADDYVGEEELAQAAYDKGKEQVLSMLSVELAEDIRSELKKEK